MAPIRPRVAKYTFEKEFGPPSKDPINIAFVDMEDGMDRVRRILADMGFVHSFFVGDQYFAEPDKTAPSRKRQVLNLATSTLGLGGRDHIRAYPLFFDPDAQPWAPFVIVGAVHHERWPEYLKFVPRPCDAVESFDAPREKIKRHLTDRFDLEEIDFEARIPFGQCSGDWPKSDGKILLIKEPV